MADQRYTENQNIGTLLSGWLMIQSYSSINVRFPVRFIFTLRSFFLGKVTALGVLCCFALFVCLTLLASFFLPSHLSFKNMYIPVVIESLTAKL